MTTPEKPTHTPGPWGWFGHNHGFYLATTHSGRRFVMDFARMGMQWAQPRFQINGRMVDGADLVRFEVDPTVQGFKDGKAAPSVYRYDITDIDHPDARLIAQAWTIPALRAVLHEAEGYFEGRADAEYLPGQAAPQGNEEMTLLCDIRAALALANEEPSDD